MALSTTVGSAFRSIYDLAFQVSPIILNGGIASGTLGGMMPIIGLTGQLVSLAQGLLSNGLSTDSFYATYVPLPGATVINNSVGMYPFANVQVAGNAIVMQPKTISLLMIAPVKDTAGYLTKLALFTSLQTSLQAHCAAGGTFHVATPSFIFTDCLLTSMTDVTSGESRQQQIQWRLDFVKPLVTQSDAASAMNSLMSKISGGSSVAPTGLAGTSLWSSAATAVDSAAQGAAQGISNLTGAISSFVTGAQ
ncbi:hypothetical protein [Burkholderia gladioli]|uniref:hypothetical protein n=1 Tax=Burkholderia gladioli TaxID=28095 RepID=UPI000BBD104C|nr:hypothetical protein [Burkholderia gladioli]ATF87574.1 hypothetical protein CO712_20940 [Burkholderia gladioli pv. gladioli]